jgi:hypothetical protein
MATVNQKEFAKLMGWTPPYVAKLIKKGKIKLTRGRMIDVDEAKAGLAALRDPSDVVRKSTLAAGTAMPIASLSPAPPQGEGSVGGYQQARSVREFYAAKTARLEYEAKAKKFVETVQVLQTWERLCGEIRTSMRSLPRYLAPLLHGKDIAIVEQMIQEAVDERLASLADDPLGIKGRANGDSIAGD